VIFDIGGPTSNSMNDTINEPRQVGLLGLESADNDDGLKLYFGTDSSSVTVVEGVVESRELDSEEKDDSNDNDIETSTLTARDLNTGNESDGDPVDDLDDDLDGDTNGIDSEETGFEEETVTTDSLASPRYLKIVVGILLLIIVFFVVIDAIFGKMYVRQAITIFLEWIRKNPGAGVIAFIVVYFIATLICVPGALLTFGAGYVFSTSNDGSLVVGVSLGTLAVFVGASASSVVAFLLARYLFYDRVRRLSQKYCIFEALDIALSEKGLRIMCLLRLSPITPFVLLNYIAGVTTVKLSSYAQSIVCIVPGTILYVFLGASAGSLTDKSENKTVTIIAVTLGVIFGVLAIGLTSHYSRKELNKEVDLVRSRLYNRTTSRRNRQRYRRNSSRRQRSRYRRRIDQKRAGRST